MGAMKTTENLSSLMIARTTTGGWFRRVIEFFCGKPDAAEVSRLADDILQVPLLQAWLLTAAGESRRIRRALLERAAQAIAREFRDAQLIQILDRMTKPRVHDAVVDELFRRGGLEPMRPGRRSGREARLRLAQLGECLEAGAALA
jgi:hypothetical protein